LREHDSVTMSRAHPSAADSSSDPQDDLRDHAAAALLGAADAVTTDTVAIFPYTGAEALDLDYCRRLGLAIVRALAFAVRDSQVDPNGVVVATLATLVTERALPIERLFTFTYLIERTAVDELAVNDTIGATTEAWPLVAQFVRRASFDVLAGFVVRAQTRPGEAAIVDQLTTLHARQVFDAVLHKEAEHAGRYGLAITLILFDVDRLSAINETHGYGVGNQILERLGILVRQYFRQHDWVARHGDDEIAVLLTGDDARHGSDLAERVRSTVEDRLGFTDHRTDSVVPVTVSGAVVNVAAGPTGLIDPERLLTEAERALGRAKDGGRNRVEVVTMAAISRALPHNSPSA
jgi:diguanylate cyclase (GGDEF)-like protein